MHELHINILFNSRQNKLEFKPNNPYLKLYNKKEKDGDGDSNSDW